VKSVLICQYFWRARGRHGERKWLGRSSEVDVSIPRCCVTALLEALRVEEDSRTVKGKEGAKEGKAQMVARLRAALLSGLSRSYCNMGHHGRQRGVPDASHSV
jgi:hypothetical protein